MLNNVREEYTFEKRVLKGIDIFGRVNLQESSKFSFLTSRKTLAKNTVKRRRKRQSSKSEIHPHANMTSRMYCKK